MANKIIYYYPDGSSISEGKSEAEQKKDFIDFYSHVYYYLNKDLKLERKIEKILEDEDGGKRLDKAKMEDILRWKVDMRYYSFVRDETNKKVLPVDDILVVTREINPEITDKKAQDVLKRLMKLTGIGAVNAIAILYICSGGKYPIYDKYAHIALMTIMDRKDYRTLVSEKERENKFHYNSSNVKTIYQDYRVYQDILKKWLGNVKYDRSVDQALWTYGHLFNESKTNKARCGMN